MVTTIALDPHLLDDPPSEKVVQDHADRPRRESEELAQLLGCQWLGGQIDDRPYPAHVALEAPELDEPTYDVAHHRFAWPERARLRLPLRAGLRRRSTRTGRGAHHESPRARAELR